MSDSWRFLLAKESRAKGAGATVPARKLSGWLPDGQGFWDRENQISWSESLEAGNSFSVRLPLPKMEGVSEVLQLSVIIKWRGSLPLESQLS